jgi:hypothetical protein
VNDHPQCQHNLESGAGLLLAILQRRSPRTIAEIQSLGFTRANLFASAGWLFRRHHIGLALGEESVWLES